MLYPLLYYACLGTLSTSLEITQNSVKYFIQKLYVKLQAPNLENIFGHFCFRLFFIFFLPIFTCTVLAGLPEPPFLAGAGAVFLVRLQLRLRLLLLLTGRVAGAARSRPFWLEPEPFFWSGSGSGFYSYSYTQDCKYFIFTRP